MNFFILTGMPAAGKTSTGKLLSGKLGISFLDTDAEILKQSNHTPRGLYLLHGEDFFRKTEYSVWEKILNCGKNPVPAVIASGGGLADNKNAFELLMQFKLKKRALILFLDLSEAVLFERLQRKAEKEKTFPVFLGGNVSEESARSAFNKLFRRRSIIYKKNADIIIKADNLTAEAVVQKIIASIKKLKLLKLEF